MNHFEADKAAKQSALALALPSETFTCTSRWLIEWDPAAEQVNVCEDLGRDAADYYATYISTTTPFDRDDRITIPVEVRARAYEKLAHFTAPRPCTPTAPTCEPVKEHTHG
jgi:hypothetical protein